MVYDPSKPLVLHGSLSEFTNDEFFAFCQANPDLSLERTAQGDIAIMTPAGFVSSAQSAEIVTQLSMLPSLVSGIKNLSSAA